MNRNLIDDYIACKELDDRIEGLISSDRKAYFESQNVEIREPDLEEIMVYLERSQNNESFTL